MSVFRSSTSTLLKSGSSYFLPFSYFSSSFFIRTLREKNFVFSLEKEKSVVSVFSFSELLVDRHLANSLKSFFLLRFFCLFRFLPHRAFSSSRRKRILPYKYSSCGYSALSNFFYFWFLLQSHALKRSESSLRFDPRLNSLSYSIHDLGHSGWPRIPVSFTTWTKSLSVSFKNVDVVSLSYFKFFQSKKRKRA